MSNEIITERSFQREEGPKAAPRIVKFTNFSNEDFTWTWNKIPYKFPAGQFRFMETLLAEHFAKHLINRELLKKGRENDTSPKNPSENVYYMELHAKAIEPVETAEGADSTAIEQEVVDRDTRARLGLKARKDTLTVPVKKPAKTVKPQDKTTPETDENFELIEGDDDDDETE